MKETWAKGNGDFYTPQNTRKEKKNIVEFELMVFRLFFERFHFISRFLLSTLDWAVWLRSIFMFLFLFFISGDLWLICSSIWFSWLIENEKKMKCEMKWKILLHFHSRTFESCSQIPFASYVVAFWRLVGYRRGRVRARREKMKMKISSFSFIFSFDAQHDDKTRVECGVDIVSRLVPTLFAHTIRHILHMKWTSSSSSSCFSHFDYHPQNFKCFSHSLSLLFYVLKILLYIFHMTKLWHCRKS